MNLNPFQKQCTSCGAAMSRDAKFCPKCGTAQAEATVVCGKCKNTVSAAGKYCPRCGEPLAAQAMPTLMDNQWSRRESDFATRVDVNNIDGFIKQELTVEPGTNALVVINGESRGMFPPGRYTLDTLGAKIGRVLSLDWVRSVTAILTDVSNVELTFNMGGLFTRDPIRVGLTARMIVELDNPALFITTLMKGRNNYTLGDVSQYLSPEVSVLSEEWIGKQTLDGLANNLRLKDEYALYLEEGLARTFKSNGLAFKEVRAIRFIYEHYDAVRKQKEQYLLQVTKTEAEAEGRRRLADAQRELDLQTLAEESRHVEIEEKKADLYKRMRDAVLSQKMDEVMSEAEFDKFIREVDHQKLLDEKERKDLQRAWLEEGQDRDRARAHLLAKLDLDRQYEIRSAELKMRGDLSQQELEGELRLEKLRATKQLEIDASKWEYDLKRRRAEADQRREDEAMRLRSEELTHKSRVAMAATSHDEEMRQLNAELELGLKGLRGIKQVRLDAEKVQLEIEKQKKELEWAQMQKEADIEIQRERIHNDYELDRLDKLGQLGSEALISASDGEQGKIIAELKKTEILKGMSEEQILAMAVKESPEVARAFQEKFRAAAEGKLNDRERELYERLLAERDQRDRAVTDAKREVHDSAVTDAERDVRDRATAEAWRESNRAVQDLADKAMNAMRDTATAFARGQTPPVIVTSSNTNPPMTSFGGQVQAQQSSGEKRLCTRCGRSVDLNALFCLHCGHEFPKGK